MRDAFKPCLSGELTPPEQRFLVAMREIGFGRFEYVQIRSGQIVLDPWPGVIRDVKFGSQTTGGPPTLAEFQLKRQLVELFDYVRTVDSGEIRTLEIKHGLPFSMEIEHRPEAMGMRRG